MLALPHKVNVLSHEINKGLSNGQEVFDPDVHSASYTKKCMDVHDCFAGWPGMNLGNL